VLTVFFSLLLTTEAMGICPSVDGQSECGSKDREMHVSQAMEIAGVSCP